MSWDKLSMAEKADIMKLAVEGGVYDLDAIRNGYNEFARGGKIHIAPSKRGTFTAAASKNGKSVQAFASQVLAHPENYSPAMRKKANFARNAAKWKHAYGGELGNYYWGLGDISNFLKKGWNKVKDAVQASAVYENPSVMTAAGWRVSRSGKAVQDKQDDAGVKQLRSNLANFGEGALGAITATGDVEAAYNIARHPVQTAKVIRNGTRSVLKNTKNTVSQIKHAFIDGEIEGDKYINWSGKSLYNWDLIKADARKGVADARNFLGSDIKSSSDAHNVELANRLGYKDFTPYTKAHERASVPIGPKYRDADAYNWDPGEVGFVIRNENPSLDEMVLHINYDVDKSGFHETLHRGYYGEYYPKPHELTPEAIERSVREESATKGLYNYKTKKLLVPKNEKNKTVIDYLEQEGEAATNIMEIGRKLGIKPGEPYPGKKKALELFNKFSESDNPGAPIFNAYNWKQKPKRVWDAATGRYYVIGAGIIPAASSTSKNK